MNHRAIFLGILFALIWSSAFTSSRILVQAAPPLTISAVRFSTAGLFAVSLAFILGQRISFGPGQWRSIITFGLCQNAVYLGFFFMAMVRIEASMAATLAATLPLWVALFSALWLGERLGALAIFGLILGFAGVLIIMVGRMDIGLDPLGLIFALIGVIGLMIATLSAKSAGGEGNLLMIVGLQMLIGAAALWPFGLIFETWRIDWRPDVIAAFAYAVFVPGLFATYIWFVLVKMIGSTRASSFHFLNPFFGVAIAALILSERLTWVDGVGVAAASLGIYLVQRRKMA